MADTRFDGYPIDDRFKTPGVDDRFSTPGTDGRFPTPGTDTRFTAVVVGVYQWTIGEGSGNYGYASGYGDLDPKQASVDNTNLTSFRAQTDGNLYLQPDSQIDGRDRFAVSFIANGRNYNVSLLWGGAFYFANVPGLLTDLAAELGNTIEVTLQR